ncbi:MAG TPA: UDP-glycosyltransferase [Flavobacterium sp.]|jgi:hypothetical protein
MPNTDKEENTKILILLPDGVGLRNFAYNDFPAKAAANGIDLIFWNNTPFDLLAMDLSEIRIPQSKNHPLTELYKNARKQIELNLSIRRFKDHVYDSYRFPSSYKSIRAAFKSAFVKWLTIFNSSSSGLKRVREKIKKEERKTLYYNQCLETLQGERPAMVFCTNQRPMSAIAPILAAQELGIPTATFIFSWDNLPKATMVIEPDYYLVWSELMKEQLLSYYSYIQENQVYVTGTPQFESHHDKNLVVPREDFFKTHGLDMRKTYICYSGDDVTTSPNDPRYLADVVAAVREINAKGTYDLGIVFRRCPVDFSARFDEVLAANPDVIKIIAPKWDKVKERWDSVFPTKEDIALQMNTIAHTQLVINLGSSMAFDYASFDKPCAYMNYDYPTMDAVRKNWSVKKTYDFVHFRSMPTKDSVIWFNDAAKIATQIEEALSDSSITVAAAKQWFEKINMHPTEQASDRIISAFADITSKNL